MKKVLIITYYWPPSGGAGVQRWLKFSKYFPEKDWQPVIYTPENAEFPAIDEQLVKDIHPDIEVVKTPIWEPYTLYKKFTSRKKEDKIGAGFTSEKGEIGTAEKLARWVRGNWFIPDARKFWIKPSVSYLAKYLKENPVDAVISTGPPHSMHLIALGVKKKFNIPWIADFRDPWTNIDFIEELRLTKGSMAKHQSQETEVLEQADVVSTAWHLMKTEFSEKVDSEKIKVILNGYDKSDFSAEAIPLDSKFTIAHLGSFSPTRNVPMLWKVLGELVKENEEFRAALQIKVAGQVDGSVRADIESNGLTEFLNDVGYISHGEVVQFMSSSQILLLVVNNTKVAKGIIPGKVFEYIMSGRPILSVGPEDGDIAQLMRDVDAEPIIEYHQQEVMRTRILQNFEQYKNGTLHREYKGIEQYDRRALSHEFTDILNQLSSKK
ncbi:MAG: glycosyltransferase family 4 protein [Flavobacteriales bacterium]